CRTASARAGLLVFAALCMLGGSPSLMGQEWESRGSHGNQHSVVTISPFGPECIRIAYRQR
ncbi:MAG: hypothetical protein AAFP69_05220, partial [Planctomycetota bacterium]